MEQPLKTKSQIRQSTKAAVRELSDEQKRSKSALIFKKIVSHTTLATAKTVALYAALGDEPQTAEAIATLSATKRVVLPRVAGNDMEFHPYRVGETERGAFGIDEPQAAEVIPAEQIDVIIVPGVAFTADGNRCGRGKGYYDKYLSRNGFRGYKIGVCFAEQVVDQMECQEHDIAVDEVIFA